MTDSETRGRRPRRRHVLAVVGVLVAGSLAAGCPQSPDRPPERAAPFPSVALNTHDQDTARYGYSLADVNPAHLDETPAGQRALVWLGGYDKENCGWKWSDDEVKKQFERYGLAGSTRVAGYFVADEPNTNLNCPQAAADVRERAALVRSLDPDTDRFTLVNVDDPNQFADFRGTTDVMSVDVYPCLVGKPCDWSKIPNAIARLREAGVTRYMGMLQAFSFEQWRWPTADELSGMIAQWQRSDWEGQLTFAWEYAGGRLADHPDLLKVLRRLNLAPHELFPLPESAP
ncbi:hypothetical protein [Streptomyces griseosporeus]|uniref:hypothetical protein n=1 Tax=Streptomyces griseosporeus TaxID=1910 RepID=UPI00167E2C2D|nr:hypothetical protein [Streptomyces griseosporeus]GHF42903.1 hypothetical protein GCM10018783_09700 [Streptomyces griseosporeus]